MAATPTVTRVEAPTHVVELNFRNEYGQYIAVITCPVAGTSVAVQTDVYGLGHCTCGQRL